MPDADRSALPWNTIVADVDVKIARDDAPSGMRAHRDIAKTGGVLIECLPTDGRVLAAGGVVKERFISNARI